MDFTGATGAGEVVARPAARTPHPTCAGGQDDCSYTNSLKPHHSPGGGWGAGWRFNAGRSTS